MRSAMAGKEDTCQIRAVEDRAGFEFGQPMGVVVVRPLQPQPKAVAWPRTRIGRVDPGMSRSQTASLHPSVVGGVIEGGMRVGGSNYR